jgi:hypothetical protein
MEETTRRSLTTGAASDESDPVTLTLGLLDIRCKSLEEQNDPQNTPFES